MTTITTTDITEPVRGRGQALIIAVALLAVIAVMSLGGIALLRDRDPGGMTLVIPSGSAASLDHPTVDSAIPVPTEMVFESGQVLTIRNEDSQANRAGPWVLAAGESLRMRWEEPGEFFYLCTVDKAESVTVTVLEDS